MKTNTHFYHTSLNYFWNEKYLSQNFVDRIKTHIFCSIIFFFENCAFREIMWKIF